MPSLRVFKVLLPCLLIAASASFARADADWQKSYPVSGKASLTMSTGDLAATVRSCGDCRAIGIRVEWRDRHASEYNLVESQSGNHVEFSLHERQRFGMHMNFGNRRGPQLTIETPAALDLEARTGDGALSVSGIHGDMQLHVGDGALSVEDVAGALHIQASDGSIRIHNAAGTLDSRSSDGSVRIDGRFSGTQIKLSDGSLDLTLAEGSRLTTASSIEASDGSVTVRVPHDLSADLEVHTSDGGINCTLPLSTDGYSASGDAHHNLRGRLNGGGVPLTIRTDDGSVSISPL